MTCLSAVCIHSRINNFLFVSDATTVCISGDHWFEVKPCSQRRTISKYCPNTPHPVFFCCSTNSQILSSLSVRRDVLMRAWYDIQLYQTSPCNFISTFFDTIYPLILVRYAGDFTQIVYISRRMYVYTNRSSGLLSGQSRNVVHHLIRNQNTQGVRAMAAPENCSQVLVHCGAKGCKCRDSLHSLYFCTEKLIALCNEPMVCW